MEKLVKILFGLGIILMFSIGDDPTTASLIRSCVGTAMMGTSAFIGIKNNI